VLFFCVGQLASPPLLDNACFEAWLACRQQETRGLGSLLPRGPQLGERQAGSWDKEAGHAGRETIKVPFSPKPYTEGGFEDLGAWLSGGGSERVWVLFLFNFPPHFI
jgi:hypothetical protein